MQAYQSAEEAIVEASVPMRLDNVRQALPVALPSDCHVRAQRLQRIRHDRCSSASRATCRMHPSPQRCISSHRGQDIPDLQCQAPALMLRFSGCKGQHDGGVPSGIFGIYVRGVWACSWTAARHPPARRCCHFESCRDCGMPDACSTLERGRIHSICDGVIHLQRISGKPRYDAGPLGWHLHCTI